jgi:Ca2+-binding RTX toxin-like protein
VLLGNGNDYIKGFGHGGNLNGGNGKDTLELPSGSYVIGISETTVNFTQAHPSISDNTMKTSELEKLIAGDKMYDFTSLSDGQRIVVA